MGNTTSLVLKDSLPEHRYFDSTYQDLICKGKKVAESFAGRLQEHAEVDAEKVEQLVRRAEALAKPDLLDTRTIAILGDSGVGKSTLINSLLDCPGLARTSASGEACTSVITEFRFKIDDDGSQFQIEVEYLTRPEIEETIKELLWNFRRINLPDVERETVSAAEWQRLEREREVAWAALSAAFGHHGEQELRDLCDRNYEGTDDETFDRLIQWTDELDWPIGGTDGKFQDSADSTDECSEKTDYFMDNRFWPFTRVIRIFTHSALLEKGLIIVDLPGLRDTNLARVKATENYLLKANHIFLLAKVERAVSDQSLKDSFALLRRHLPNEWDEDGASRLKVTVICTRAEDMKFSDMKRDFVVKRKMVDAKVVAELENKLKLGSKGTNVKLKKQSKQELRLLYMRARNDYVNSRLRVVYEKETKGSLLEVFCVSNSLYEKTLEDHDIRGITASNIPALRRHCYSIVADIRLAESNNFLLSTLPSFLESVQLWYESLSLPIRNSSKAFADALDWLRDFKVEVHNAFFEAEAALKELFSDQISHMMAHRNAEWDKEALARSRDWTGWHWASYDAFVRNDGTHTTPKVGHRRWNNEMLWKMREELQFSWNLIEEEIPGEFKKLKEKITSKINEFADDVGSLDLLVRVVRLQAGNFEFRTGLVERSALELTRHLRRKASEDNSTSFILGAMRPAYRQAALISGKSLYIFVSRKGPNPHQGVQKTVT